MAASLITYLRKVFGTDPTTGYFSVDDANELKDVVNEHAGLLDNLESDKVDKVTGERLISDAEISKLSGIEAGAQVNAVNTVVDANYVSGFTAAMIKATGQTLTPSAILLTKEAGTSFIPYQQTGVLALVVTSATAILNGVADFDIIKTADAITVLVDSTNITIIGKWPSSSDFSTTVGDIDHVIIFKKEPNTNNSTGIYYCVTNLG